MKILNTFIDARLGGPQRRTLDIAKEIRGRGFESEFLLPRGGENFRKAISNQGFALHSGGYRPVAPLSDVVGNLGYVTSSTTAIPRIKNIIDQHNVDIVHVNVSVNFHSSIAAYLSDSTLVWHFNDTLMPRPISKIAGRTARTLADQIVVSSDSVANHYFRKPTTDIRTLYAPVDTSEFDPTTTITADLRAKNDIHPDALIVGTIGNLNPVKGHEHVIKALPHIQRSISTPITLAIVGAELESRRNYARHLKDLVRILGVEDQVKFLGHRSDIPEVLNAFDVFVLSSISEAFPIVVLEAMAMKRPVVASAVGGVPKQINHSVDGWLYNAKDSEAMARAITEALDDPDEALRRGMNARDKVIKNFSLERIGQEYERLYNEI